PQPVRGEQQTCARSAPGREEAVAPKALGRGDPAVLPERSHEPERSAKHGATSRGGGAPRH
ncbi:MAG: hypothetical protein ACRD21_23550, partial [Vicinamibacteria bacterium]